MKSSREFAKPSATPAVDDSMQNLVHSLAGEAKALPP
jgi:hypothetical protein